MRRAPDATPGAVWFRRSSRVLLATVVAVGLAAGGCSKDEKSKERTQTVEEGS